MGQESRTRSVLLLQRLTKSQPGSGGESPCLTQLLVCISGLSQEQPWLPSSPFLYLASLSSPPKEFPGLC